MSRACNMPPVARSKFWDGDMFCLVDAAAPADRFASIASDIGLMLMQLDGTEAAQLDAVAGIRAALWASNLSLADLAQRIRGAVPRRQVN